MYYERKLDEILKTNKELREVFEKHPERRELYLQKMKDSDNSSSGHGTRNPAWCQTCVFSHGEPPFADMPEKAYCQIYTREKTTGKPPNVYYEGAECEFFIKSRTLTDK